MCYLHPDICCISPQIKPKEVVSITFPPTKEPTIGLPKGVSAGEATPNPLDDFYEDYDTADLPSLDLDFVDVAPSPEQTLSNGRPAPEVTGWVKASWVMPASLGSSLSWLDAFVVTTRGEY